MVMRMKARKAAPSRINIDDTEIRRGMRCRGRFDIFLV